MSDSGSRPRKENCFDFLRLFAALCVVVAHSAEHLRLRFLWLAQDNPHSYWFYDGVPLFFVLSGFLIYRSYQRCVEKQLPVWHYFRNRFLRVAPALYVYVLATTALLWAVGVVSEVDLISPQYIAWFVGHLVFLPTSPDLFSGFGVGYINGSLWTITAEVGFYLFVPVLCYCERRFGFRRMIAVVALVALLGQLVQGWIASATHPPKILLGFRCTFLPYMLFFGLGVFWSRAWERVPKNWPLVVGCLFVYVMIRIVNVLDVPSASLSVIGFRYPLYYVTWSICLSYVTLWVAHYGPGVLGGITRRIGDISYGMYIWHMIVINLLLFLDVPAKLAGVPGAAQICVITVTLVLATLSWRYVEKPALQFKAYSLRTREGGETSDASNGVLLRSPAVTAPRVQAPSEKQPVA